MYSLYFLAFGLCTSISLASPVEQRAAEPDADGILGYEERHALEARATTSTAAVLPSPSQFKADNGTKWTIKYVGDIGYTGALATENLQGDKCRSSSLGGKTFWNCGDMECNGDPYKCGFAMGPAFYATSSVLTINTTGITNVANNNFVLPWSGDPQPVSPQTAFGMDTSNVAAINSTHGVAYAWEIWRGASDGSYVDRGNAVASITLGTNKPNANRVGPLLTGPKSIQLGLVAILRDGNYIYQYSYGGPSNLIVTRVAASDAVFDATKYSALKYNTTTWVNTIPNQNDTAYGMVTANPSNQFACLVYGSIFYSSYLQKYTIICNIYEYVTSMYVSSTPYGPWSDQYVLLDSWHGYGSHAHPEFSANANQKQFYFSQGPDGPFNTFQVSFNY